MLIYPIQADLRTVKEAKLSPRPYPSDGSLLVGLGLSFPVFDDSAVRSRVVYRVNLVEWRSMFDVDLFDGEFGDDRAFDDDNA